MNIYSVKNILNFKLFKEARFQDVFKSDIDSLNSYKLSQFDDFDDFIKFITLKMNNKKIRFEIKYNHNLNHNLKNRIKNRTSLISIKEFNIIIRKSLEELFLKYSNEIKDNGLYSLYLKEYNFSIILNINYNFNEFFIKTIKSGINTINVKNIIEINSIL